MAPEEVLVAVLVPWTRPLQWVKEFKQAHRRDDDIALVNAGMQLRLDAALRVESACLAFGGVGPTVVVAHATAAALVGRPFGEDLVKARRSPSTPRVDFHTA